MTDPIALVPIDWQPIATMPFGKRVLLFFERGEKGNGEIDTNWVYNGDSPEEPWIYWTWGGPNSGSDFTRDERPVLWAPVDPLVEEARRAARAMGGESA
jgi:hypothetical protein